MGFKESYVFLCILLLLVLGLEATLDSDYLIHSINRRSFPKDFVFGAASSAYQYEGAAFEDGKGPNIWDNFTHQYKDKIIDGSNGDIAVDSYHRYKEDVLTLKDIGFNAYRFSISWSRILPKGRRRGGVNWKGIRYYKKLIHDLLAKGIQPYATLFHWDVPQALEVEYQGFLNSSIVNDFEDYVDLCFKEFGGMVKHWITLNEQLTFSLTGYAAGTMAPGRCSKWLQNNCPGGHSGTEPYIVGHNQILAHAAAVRIYRTKYQASQKGVIGISLVSNWLVPNSTSEADENATRRVLDFTLGWFLHPLIYGDYPPVMRDIVKDRLPNFTEPQRHLIKGSIDFVGLNYYTTNYVADNPITPPEPAAFFDYQASLSTDRNGVPIGPKANATSWIASYPKGLEAILIYTMKYYQNPIIYITENGNLDYDDFPIKKLIEDFGRIEYHEGHLKYLHKAIERGVRVKGYFAWSLLDNFEWSSGYTVRFGLTYIDYKKNLTRVPKLSAKWFTRFLHDEHYYNITLLYKPSSNNNIAEF